MKHFPFLFALSPSMWIKPQQKNAAKSINDNLWFLDNAAEVVDMIQDLVDVQLDYDAELLSSELDTVVEKLSKVVAISIITPAVGANIFNIVADILLSKTDITRVANM